MKNKREIDQATATNHSPEVDYSLLIMVMMVEMLEKVEISPAVATTEFTSNIRSGSVLVFLCF
jgi:hypothetical protein